MSLRYLLLCTASALLAVGACAKAEQDTGDGGGGGDGGTGGDGPSCGESCDQDGDGVPDGADQCPDTPAGEVVNQDGCSESQLTPTLEPTFPPFELMWTSTGELGRDGGLSWSYAGIQRADLFHIYWVLCDDPATPCGLSLDGPIDLPSESWTFSAPDSDLPAGRLVFTCSTRIMLFDMTLRTVSGRLTVTIVDGNDQALPFTTLAGLGVTGRLGQYGAEIPGTGFHVTALAEAQDTTMTTWLPYLDYYDAAPTPDPGEGTVTTSFGGSFYSE